jgi:DNA-binding transcriptional LysR family regulator
MKTLEQSLDLVLFDRSGQRVTLTKEGREVLEEGREVLRTARALERRSAMMSQGWEPDLHVVLDGTLSMHPIADVLRTFQERKIPTRIRLDVEYQEGVPDRFFDEKADIMLILDYEDETGTLNHLPLHEVGMVLAAAPEHPLLLEEELTPEVLARHMQLVVRDSSPKYRNQPKLAFTESQQVVHLSDFHSKRLGMLERVGYGWIPEHLVEDDLASGDLVVVESASTHRWTYHPGAVTRKQPSIGRAGQLFLDLLNDVMGKR